MVEQIEERKANTPEGAAKRAALVKAMDLKNYEFNAHGVELGQFYTSTAIVSDGSRPEPTRDPDLYYEASTIPGARLPHAWVGDNRRRLAMMDLAPYSRFTLVTGIAGEEWEAVAQNISRELGVPVETVVVGPGRAVTDLYYDWAKLREVDESGALLVRPDKHIGWRAVSMPADPEGALRNALEQILGRSSS